MINHHCVPDFEMDEDYSFPTSSSAVSRSRKSPLPENEIMELLWQNGQVVMQSQNQRSIRRSPPSKLEHENNDSNNNNNNNHLFMQEDEMAAWLHYPLDEDNFCAQLELLDNNNFNNMNMSSQSQTTTQTNINPMVRTSQPQPQPQPPPSRPPIPPSRRSELAESKVSQFPSRQKGYYYDEETNKRMAAAAAVRESSTIVDSNETPETWAVVDKGCATMSGGGAEVAVTSSGGGGGGGGGSKVEMVTCELTVTSSPGCSSASAEAGQKEEAAGEDRKRKSMEADDADADADDDADAECHSEDVEFESADAKKQVRGSTSTKRSRAAEVHNLSERRRRDRINEKMKALQELIPRCNKSDKASMLDEAIEYLKSLQLQVQMMSMGCGMFPMIFPGVQQYMPTMGMGIGMGMGMGMEMGINRPMFPFPNMLAGSGLPTGAAAHLGPRFPMPAFMPHVPVPDPSRIQSNQSEQMLNSLGAQHPSQSWFPNFTDPYQQYVAPHQMQLPLSQNQAMAQPSTSKPSTSRGPENLDNNQSGT